MQPEAKISTGTKVRVDFTDVTGAKYSVNIQDPSKENLAKLLDFVSTLSPQSPHEQNLNQPIDTNFARVYGLIETRFKFASFNSGDVLEAYEHEFGLPSSLSTISTYLARLGNRGLLTRSRSGLGWMYRLVKNDDQTTDIVNDLPSQASIITR